MPCGRPCRGRSGVASLVDIGDRNLFGPVADRTDPDASLDGYSTRTRDAGRWTAGFAGGPWHRRHAVGRRDAAGALERSRFIPEAAGDPTAACAVPPISQR